MAQKKSTKTAKVVKKTGRADAHDETAAAVVSTKSNRPGVGKKAVKKRTGASAKRVAKKSVRKTSGDQASVTKKASTGVRKKVTKPAVAPLVKSSTPAERNERGRLRSEEERGINTKTPHPASPRKAGARSKTSTTAHGDLAKSRIKRPKKPTWDSGETSITRLPAEERGKIFGLRTSEEERSATRKAIRSARRNRRSATEEAAIAKSFDWRDQGVLTAVKSQISNHVACNACVAFGTLAVVEARINIVGQTSDPSLDLSEAHLFFFGGGSCANGWSVQPALEFCRDKGIAPESDFIYKLPIALPVPPPQPTVKIRTFTKVFDPEEAKRLLNLKGPLIGSMTVFSDFQSYQGKVYEPTTQTIVGEHVIAIVGYNDMDKFWIGKNSWGTGWGENGYVKIRYETCGIGVAFPFWDLDPDVASNTGDSDQNTLQGILDQASNNGGLRRCLKFRICGSVSATCSIDQSNVAETVNEILIRRPELQSFFCDGLENA